MAGTLVSIDANMDGNFWDAAVLADVHGLSLESFLQDQSVIV